MWHLLGATSILFTSTKSISPNASRRRLDICNSSTSRLHVWLFGVHTHSHLTWATQGRGGHSCLLFKEEKETCQEKIVWSRKLSWLESPSFLLVCLNAASSQSFTPKDSIMITLIFTTPCFVTGIQAETWMSFCSMAFTPETNNPSSVSGEWRDLSDYMQPDIFVWPTFTLSQSSHHTQPPQTRYFKSSKRKHVALLFSNKTSSLNANAAFLWVYTC